MFCIAGEIHIFDWTKHPSKPAKAGKAKPNARLTGHTDEGYGLAWSPHEEGIVVSGAQDKLVLVWNIQDKEQNAKSIKVNGGFFLYGLVCICLYDNTCPSI